MQPDLENYFRDFVPRRDPLLLELEREAQAEGIPIVGPVVGELLFILARVTARGQPPGAGHRHRLLRHLPGPGLRTRRRPGPHPGAG